MRVDRNASTLDDMAAVLGTLPLEFSPGTAWNYSVATDVCGLLVERMAGIPFDRYLRERIFEPLGVIDTFRRPRGQADRFAANYQRSDKSLQLVDGPWIRLRPPGDLLFRRRWPGRSA